MISRLTGLWVFVSVTIAVLRAGKSPDACSRWNSFVLTKNGRTCVNYCVNVSGTALCPYSEDRAASKRLTPTPTHPRLPLIVHARGHDLAALAGLIAPSRPGKRRVSWRCGHASQWESSAQPHLCHLICMWLLAACQTGMVMMSLDSVENRLRICTFLWLLRE